MIERINKAVDEIGHELKKMTLTIHDNPELGLQEYKACGCQIALLRKYGFEIEEKFCGLDTAYKASYKSGRPGPKIAMLAEYDALPELGHGCGHNLIALVAVGAGIAMREFADELGGEIYVFGTPAEETYGGKVTMADAGAFDEMDVAMMSHPAFMDCESMNTMAMNAYKISFFGQTAHASAAPQEGINALDGVISFFNMVNALRQQTQDDSRIHGIISKGGEAPNIIPDYAESILYVRAAKIDYLEKLCEKVVNCAKGAALGTGTRVEIEPAEGNFKDINTNRALSALNMAQMEKLGVNLMKTDPDKAMPGSSDMGDVSYRCPAIQSCFDITKGVPIGAHTVEFMEAAGSDYGIERGLVFAKGFVLTAVELMRNPEELKTIQDEFQKISRRP